MDISSYYKLSITLGCMMMLCCLPTWAQTEGHYISVKTNAVAWATVMPNAAIDVQCHPHLSIEIPVAWSPWHLGAKRGIKHVVFQPECRWWLEKPGEGHFFGVHAHVGWFNLKWERDRYQDAQCPLWGAGIAYGYLMPLSGTRWAGEFTIGAGYARIRYDRFYNLSNGARIDTASRNYLGITRIGISLVYRLSKETS